MVELEPRQTPLAIRRITAAAREITNRFSPIFPAERARAAVGDNRRHQHLSRHR
jgi:hypothetical protein